MTELLRELAAALRRHRTITFVLSVVVAGIAVNALSDFAVAALGAWQTAVISLAIALATLVLLRPTERLGDFIQTLRTAELTPEVRADIPRHKGLIVLSSIGAGISSAETAIRYHWRGVLGEHEESILHHCWIVTCGPASKTSADALVAKLVTEGFRADMFHIAPLSPEDADNPEALHRQIDRIYDEAATCNLSEDEIIADYTGGSKSMTAGMVLACTSPQRPLQFMKPRKYTSDGRADPSAGADPMGVDIRFRLVPQPARRQGAPRAGRGVEIVDRSTDEEPVRVRAGSRN